MNDEVDSVRRAAHTSYAAGDFAGAVQHQLSVINQLGPGSPDAVDDQVQLAAYLFAIPDYAAALNVVTHVEQHRPDDPTILANKGVLLSRLERFEEAKTTLQQAHALDANNVNTIDALARVSARLGLEEEARDHGEASLRMKDEDAAGAVYPVPESLPPFDSDSREKNIIAFSLWGDNPRYLDGALENARLTPEIYPGWCSRFYCDESVPEAARKGLEAVGAQIVMMTRTGAFDGLFWRFQVINDGSTQRFLIRDADSIINPREQAAVAEWLSSGKAFHVMRDNWSHTELILAGMWGGIGGILPSLTDLLKEFQSDHVLNFHADQWFLRECVWPTVRQSVLQHDSCYSALGSIQFPADSDLPEGQHVGQNAAALG